MTIMPQEGFRTGAEHTEGICYELEKDGSFRIDNYSEAPAFSSFLPGIAGVDGVPLWCMYVNRGQAVVSFGVESKNRPVVEFLPATWAYQLVGIQGFRTFCKVDGEYYEPFQDSGHLDRAEVARSMLIRPDRVELDEVNRTLGLQFGVEYFSPPHQPLGSLVRSLKITNRSKVSRQLSLLDGLPIVIPSGISDFGAKALRRIHEAYARVSLARADVPFFSTRVVAHDEAEVLRVEHGNFYAAWMVHGSSLMAIEPLIDPDVVFGAGHDLVTPRRFIHEQKIDRAAQTWENRLPCALVPWQGRIDPGASVSLVAIIGQAPRQACLGNWLKGFQTVADIDAVSIASERLIRSVTSPATAASSLPNLDAYVQQNYLDNVLRGGVPVLLPSKSGPTPLHLYSRRHGDLERDYNHFVLPPHPLSSGAGNYRDICQNRRWDVWFHPEVGDSAIRMFVSLLQADGYNPLSIEGYRWILPRDVNANDLCPSRNDDALEEFLHITQRAFHPGELVRWAQARNVDPGEGLDWVFSIIAQCDRTLVADGHEGGYWIDHWTYIVDLLESFDRVYPDRVGEMLTGPSDITWFQNGAEVRGRHDRYSARPNGVRQLNAVVDCPVGRVPLGPVSVLAKLCALVAIKAVSFDFEGKGIEMEAGRPGWNDSLNGLPSLFGSSSCEAAELARLSRWLLDHVPADATTEFPVEVAALLDDVIGDVESVEYSWDRSSRIRENFRRRSYADASGECRGVTSERLKRMLEGVANRATRAVEKSIDPETGLCHTYYAGNPRVNGASAGCREADRAPEIVGISQEPLPLYLEGQVHYLRMVDKPETAQRIYRAVRKSGLFDRVLKMYKINENLEGCSPEIGRARTFTRGWYENESIWLHMSYKYLLELLRAGLHDEFFDDAQTMLVPFMDPSVYGRSILENSSFLGSSANPDKHTHGRGFVARLSGSTAEFIHMWLLLTVGDRPFYLEDGVLNFRVSPILPGSWFTCEPRTIEWHGRQVLIEADSFCCTAMGTTLLVYRNAARRNTFGSDAVKPVKYELDCVEQFEGASLGPDHAHRIRTRNVTRIDVSLE